MANAKALGQTTACVLLALMATACSKDPTSAARTAAAAGDPLHCYTDATARPAMEKLARLYETQTGRKVRIEPAAGRDMLERVQTGRTGDLCVTHDPIAQMLTARGLALQCRPAALLTPVIVVARGNPRNVASVRDLARPGLRLAVPNAESSSMGYAATMAFDKANLRADIEANIVLRTPDDAGAAALVAAGKADAAIVSGPTARANAARMTAVKIEPACLPIAGVDAVTSASGRSYDLGQIRVVIATLACSTQPGPAGEFAAYVQAHHRVLVDEFGFTPAPASMRVERLRLCCDTALRPGVENACRVFARKSGTRIEASYQDAGTLIATLRLKRVGDVCVSAEAAAVDALATDGSVESRAARGRLTVGVLTFSQNKPLARAFAAWLTGPDGQAALAPGRTGSPPDSVKP